MRWRWVAKHRQASRAARNNQPQAPTHILRHVLRGVKHRIHGVDVGELQQAAAAGDRGGGREGQECVWVCSCGWGEGRAWNVPPTPGQQRKYSESPLGCCCALGELAGLVKLAAPVVGLKDVEGRHPDAQGDLCARLRQLLGDGPPKALRHGSQAGIPEKSSHRHVAGARLTTICCQGTSVATHQQSKPAAAGGAADRLPDCRALPLRAWDCTSGRRTDLVDPPGPQADNSPHLVVGHTRDEGLLACSLQPDRNEPCWRAMRDCRRRPRLTLQVDGEPGGCSAVARGCRHAHPASAHRQGTMRALQLPAGLPGAQHCS